jgi:hypothetical protein
MSEPKWKKQAIPLDDAQPSAPKWKQQAIPLDREPATPAIPGPQASAYRDLRKLPGGARLLEGPNKTQVFVSEGTATTDPKKIKALLKPFEAAEKSRAEAAALRQKELEAAARDKELIERGLVRAPEAGSMSEVAAAALEAKARKQEADFVALTRRDVEQQLGADIAAQKPIAAGALQFLKGIPFVGALTDEAMGAVTQTPAMTQMGISATDITRGAQAETERAAPVTSTGLQLAGGVTGIVGTPGLLPAITPRGVTVGAQVASGITRGGIAGGLEGAATGAGLAEEGGRTEGAIVGGLMGAGIGTVAGAIPPGAEQAMVNARNYISRVDDNRLARELGVSRETATVLRSALQAEDFDAAVNALQRAGESSMLADASPVLRDFLDVAMQAGGPGAKRGARNAIEARITAGSQRFNAFMDRVLGIPRGRETQAQGIRLASAPERERVYAAAYAVPIDYSNEAGRNLQAMLDRVPISAINRANQLMRVEGVTSPQIMANVADDGTVTFTRLPDVRQFDYIRRALADIVESTEGRGAMGGVTAYGRSVGNLSREMRDTLGEVVPEYRTALNTAADTIAEVNAADVGYRAFGGTMTREQVRNALEDMTPPERIAAQIGLRNAIDDKLARIGQLASDPNRDAKELQALTKQMTSPDFREKLETIVGPGPARDFIRQLEEEIAAVELRAAVNPNSATFRRGDIMQTIRGQTQPGILRSLLRDGPVRGLRNLTQALSGTTDEALMARDRGILDEIATILTQTRGQDAQDALRIVQRSIAGQEMNENQARIVAGVLVRPSVLGAALATTQELRENRTVGAAPAAAPNAFASGQPAAPAAASNAFAR